LIAADFVIVATPTLRFALCGTASRACGRLPVILITGVCIAVVGGTATPTIVFIAIDLPAVDGFVAPDVTILWSTTALVRSASRKADWPARGAAGGPQLVGSAVGRHGNVVGALVLITARQSHIVCNLGAVFYANLRNVLVNSRSFI